MKNIFMIFITDFKRIKTNVVAIVVIMGLVVIPSLYAWFNILSNWDPYGEDATGRIKVAIASDDVGIDLGNTAFNLGDKVIEALHSNHTIGWEFPESTQEARDGVYEGEYYAALIIPETFTADLVSVLTDNVSHPTIEYYENEKKNAIAPKITAKAKTAVQEQVNSSFVSVLSGSLTEALSELVDTEELEELGLSDTSTILDVLLVKLEDSYKQIETVESLVDSFVIVTDSLIMTTEAADNLETVDNVTTWGQNTLGTARNNLSYGIVGKMPVAQTLSAGLGSIQGMLKTLSATYDESKESFAQFNQSIADMNDALKQSQILIGDMKINIVQAISDIEDMKSGDSYGMLLDLITSDADTVGGFISSPVSLEKVRVFPVDYYGSAMSPFYSVLAIWVGSLILVAIIHVGVHVTKKTKKATLAEKFFGRYISFFLIGQLQALLVVLGDLYFVQIQCENPFKLWLAASVTSFTFTMLIYALTFGFGNLGEGAAVILMVIQVAGAGCTFPIQVLPQIFQDIYKFLPFPYAMDAMRECVGGFYENYYWECIGHLLLFIPVSVMIGLFGGKYFVKINSLIEKNKEGSGIMI